MELIRPLTSLNSTVVLLNSQLPETIRVSSIVPAPRGVILQDVTSYVVHCDFFPDDLPAKIADFFNRETCIVERLRKNRLQKIDLRSLVTGLMLQNGFLHLEICSYQGKPGTSPREVLQKVLGLDEQSVLLARIMKTKVSESTSPS